MGKKLIVLGIVLSIIGFLILMTPDLFTNLLNLTPPPIFGFILGIIGVVLGTIGLATFVIRHIEDIEIDS